MDSLIDFLQWALPTGFVSSLITWIISRRKQNNDMLSQLQASINMLSTENRKILDENIILRRENAEFKVKQEEMNICIAQLTKEVERLRKSLIGKNRKDEKPNKVAGVSSVGRNVYRLHHAKTDVSKPVSSVRNEGEVGYIENCFRLDEMEVAATSSSVQGDPNGGEGGDTSLSGESGDTDREPP